MTLTLFTFKKKLNCEDLTREIWLWYNKRKRPKEGAYARYNHFGPWTFHFALGTHCVVCRESRDVFAVPEGRNGKTQKLAVFIDHLVGDHWTCRRLFGGADGAFCHGDHVYVMGVSYV